MPGHHSLSKGSVRGRIVALPIPHAEVLTPECDYLETGSLKRRLYQRRSLRWPLIQSDRCLCGRRSGRRPADSGDGHPHTRSVASGETNPADVSILDFQPAGR